MAPVTPVKALLLLAVMLMSTAWASATCQQNVINLDCAIPLPCVCKCTADQCATGFSFVDAGAGVGACIPPTSLTGLQCPAASTFDVSVSVTCQGTTLTPAGGDWSVKCGAPAATTGTVSPTTGTPAGATTVSPTQVAGSAASPTSTPNVGAAASSLAPAVSMALFAFLGTVLLAKLA